MALSINDFGKAVVAAGLLSAGALKSLWDSLPSDARSKDAAEFAKLLVAREKLTSYQASEILAGRGPALVMGDNIILDKIGAGGMGQVFKAQHRRMKRLVAIKLLPSAMTKDEAAVKRFEREVEAAARLSHPNIVTAYDAGVVHSAHYLVMEYVEGKDLSQTVKSRGPLPVAEALNYITQAARGLAYAHSEGVVHRDIKPANLLLDKKGVVKILDMGLARFEEANSAMAAAEEGLTQSGQVMGTVDYMAPEQAFDTRHADARADVYSLGCSLYRLLIGENVYSGDTLMQKFMAHREKPVPSLRAKRPEVPEALDAIFQKMMAKLPEDRYQPTSQLVSDLEACFSGSTAKLAGSPASSTNLAEGTSPGLYATEVKDGMTAALGNPLLHSLPDSPEELREETFSSSSNDRTHCGRRGQKTAAKVGGEGPRWKNPLVLGAAGTVSLLIVLLGIWVIVRNKGGNEVAKVKVPDGGSVEVKTAQGAGQAKNPKSEISHPNAELRTANSSPPPLAKAPFDAAQAKAHQAAWAKYLGTTVELVNSVGQKMILIPPGEFLMGSTPEQLAVGRKAGEEESVPSGSYYFRQLPTEAPQHQVVVSQPFLMSSAEVTVGQFRKFVEVSKHATEAEQYGFGNSAEKTFTEKVKEGDKGKNWKSPGYAVTDDSPVTQVSWNDAAAYCTWLSEQEGRRPWYRPDAKGGWLLAVHADGYRLPTEAEWEYACRAGTTTQYSFGEDKALLEQYGWFNQNSGGKPQPVASKRPNPFGLFDMHGNIFEWCQDWYDSTWYEKSSPADPIGPSSGDSRVFRGGRWQYYASSCRSASRFYNVPSSRSHFDGFRCVRVADAAAASQLATGTATIQPNRPWNRPAFQMWMKEVQALPAEQQLEAVSKKLMELNPGFDGKLTGIHHTPTPKIENGVVAEVGFNTEKVIDISPVRAFVGLKVLKCIGSKPEKGGLSDLSPLTGMPLTGLWFNGTRVSDTSPLQGMNLTSIAFTPANITKGLDVIRQMKSLKSIGLRGDRDKFPADEFWKRFDAGEFDKPSATNID